MCVHGWRYITPYIGGINSKSSWTWGISQRGGDSKSNQCGALTASWTWWKFGMMGIRANQDDICLKSNSAPTLGGGQKCLLIDQHYVRPLHSLVHPFIFNIISKNDAPFMYLNQTGEPPDKLLYLLQSNGSSSRCQWSRCSATSLIWTWLAFPQIARLALQSMAGDGGTLGSKGKHGALKKP